MRKLIMITILAAVVLAACAPGSGQDVEENRLVTIYKMPT